MGKGLIEDNYLKNSIEEINHAFMIDPLEDLTFHNPVPLTGHEIIKCWKFYHIEGIDGEECEIHPRTPENFNSKTDIKEFDFGKLEDILDFDKFELDIKAIVTKSEIHFKTTLEQRLLNLSTELQIKHWIDRYVKSIIKSIEFFEAIALNRVQGLVKNIYLNSYHSTLRYLKETYNDYFPMSIELPASQGIEVNPVSKYIYNDDLHKFKEIEQKLIDTGYLKDIAGNLNWIKDKTKLVDLVRILEAQNDSIIRRNMNGTKLFQFFEKRYDIDLGTLRRESKYKTRPLDTISIFDFLFD